MKSPYTVASAMKKGRASDTVALDRTDREGLSEEAGHYGDLVTGSQPEEE